MICERCNSIEATVHLTEIIKGVKSEVHLCEECARDIGLNSKLSNFSLAVPDFLSFLNDEIREINDGAGGTICKNCGLDFITAKRRKNFGCPYCYHFFSDKISEIFSDDENEMCHTGRVPNSYTDFSIEYQYEKERIDIGNDVNQLKLRLDMAVKKEEYEEAALLRDKIKDLEQMCRGN